MNRRSLLLSATTALGFLVNPLRRSLRSPIFNDVLGKPISATLGSNYSVSAAYIENGFRPIHCFPIENIVTVNYERGVETWVTYNMSMDDAAHFSMKEFLTSKYELPNASCIGGHLNFRNSKFKLATLAVTDNATEDKATSVENYPYLHNPIQRVTNS